MPTINQKLIEKLQYHFEKLENDTETEQDYFPALMYELLKQQENIDRVFSASVQVFTEKNNEQNKRITQIAEMVNKNIVDSSLQHPQTMARISEIELILITTQKQRNVILGVSILSFIILLAILIIMLVK